MQRRVKNWVIVIGSIPATTDNYYIDHLIHYEVQNGDILICHSFFIYYLVHFYKEKFLISYLVIIRYISYRKGRINAAFFYLLLLVFKRMR